MNVMLVGNSDFEMNTLKEYITAQIPKAEIHAFSDVSSAMKYADDRLVDIAVIDTAPSGRAALNLAKELIGYYPRVNVIFVSDEKDYALEAHNIYCSAYLMKPVSEAMMQRALNNLRYPVESRNPDIYIQCFGNFEVFHKGEPVHFRYSLTKQLLAYLVDRNGADCTTSWMEAALFNDDDGHASYLKQLRKDLLDTFASIQASDLIRSGKGTLSINRNQVSCDYFDYLDGRSVRKGKEYMLQYPYELLKV